MNRQKFINSLRKRFSLRLHMTMILFATSLAGVLASKALLMLGMHNVAIRYPITVICAYGIFFLAIKIWLWIVADPGPTRSLDGDSGRYIDLNFPISSGTDNASAFPVGGGTFNGGGATGSFDSPLGGAVSDAGSSLSGVGDAVGDVVGGAADDEGGLVLVIVLGLLAVLLFSILGAGMFLVWQAPAILAEAAFDAILAASLVRSSKRINEPDWVGSVFRATWRPFVIVLMLSLVSGWAMHKFLPETSRVLDVIHMIM